MFTPTQRKGKEAKKQVEYSTHHKQAGKHAEEVTHVQTSSFDFRKQQSSSERASKETKGTTIENFQYLSMQRTCPFLCKILIWRSEQNLRNNSSMRHYKTKRVRREKNRSIISTKSSKPDLKIAQTDRSDHDEAIMGKICLVMMSLRCRLTEKTPSSHDQRKRKPEKV
ncbi:hypothetical protein NC651_032052 [Populus alba x Populus x berolinensis]|nr:hypothetical protein NC651_032052 [Populus alba x Populus x berolinensis]